MPLPKDFPPQSELDRIGREHDLHRLYACQPDDITSDRFKFRLREFFENDKDKAKLLDRALNVAPLIVDVGTAFLFGEPFRVETDAKDGQSDPVEKETEKLLERTELRRKLTESSRLYESVGHAHFHVYRDAKDEAVIEEIPYSYYFPDWDQVDLGGRPRAVRLVSYITRDLEGGGKQGYMYVREYRMEGEKAVCERSLWEETGKRATKQVPLDTLGFTAAPGARGSVGAAEYVVEDTGIDEIPVVTVDGPKTALDRHGRSILERVRPLLYELNDRVTQLSLQFLKHLNAKLQIPEGSVTRDKDGNVVAVSLEVLIARAGDPEARYITNDNPLIEQAFTHIQKILRQVAKITQTPDSFLDEDEKGGVEKSESLKVRLMAFLKRIRANGTAYEAGIVKLIRLARKIEGKSDPETRTFRVVFDPGFPKDWEQDGNVWGAALVSGIASKETAVRRFQDIDGDELAAEMKRIKSDEKEAMQSQIDLETATNPPPPGGDQPPEKA